MINQILLWQACTQYCPNGVKSDKRRNQTWEILLLITVGTVSFPQMKISRKKIRFHRFSNIKIMVAFVTLDLYIPIYQIEFISCWILSLFIYTYISFPDHWLFFDFKIYNCTVNLWQVMSDAMKGLRPLCSVKAEGKQDKLHDLELIKVLI